MEILKTVLLGVPVLKVTGDLDHLAAPALEKAVQDAQTEESSRILFDLEDCPYLDSGGLSVLLFALRRVPATGWLGAVAPNSNVLRLLEIVGLTANPSFRVFSNSNEALIALDG